MLAYKQMPSPIEKMMRKIIATIMDLINFISN
jgi:hypothetical protein